MVDLTPKLEAEAKAWANQMSHWIVSNLIEGSVVAKADQGKAVAIIEGEIFWQLWEMGYYPPAQIS